MTIAAYIMVKNEEDIIGCCLDALTWCDKVYVFDTGSEDGTKEIARSKGASLEELEFIGFGPTRNKIIEKIEEDWIVCFDADEICSKALAEEIKVKVRENKTKVFRACRRNFLLGKEIKHSGWCPDYRHPVLFKKGFMKYDDSDIHEGFITNEKVGILKNTFKHFSYRSLDQLMEKGKNYAILGSQKLKKKGYKSSFGKAMLHSTAAFLRHFLIKKGFLDGRYGFIIAFTNSYSTFFKYMEAIEGNNLKKKNKIDH